MVPRQKQRIFVNEYIKLNELRRHGLSTREIDKFLNLLVNAKE
jgi:hypothetical protein